MYAAPRPSPAIVYFEAARSNAAVWSITDLNENAPNGIIRGRLTRQGDRGGSVYLRFCGNGSGGSFCNGDFVFVGTAQQDSNGNNEEYLICDVVVGGDRTCSLDCDVASSDNDYVRGDGSWSIAESPPFGASAFTPLIEPV